MSITITRGPRVAVGVPVVGGFKVGESKTWEGSPEQRASLEADGWTFAEDKAAASSPVSEFKAARPAKRGEE